MYSMSQSHSYPPFPYREHGACEIVPHMEIYSLVFDWGHKDSAPGRYFGKFECDECDHFWHSAWTWLGRGQKCRECVRRFGWSSVDYTNPSEVAPRRIPKGPRVQGKKSLHNYERCEYCAELCGSTKVKPTHHACEKIKPGDPYARAYRR